MQLRMTDHRQTAVKFPCAADNTSSCVEDARYVAACLSWSLELWPTLRCNSQCRTSRRHARVSQLTRSQGNVGLVEVDVSGRSKLRWCWWHASRDSGLMKSSHRGPERHHSRWRYWHQAAKTGHDCPVRRVLCYPKEARSCPGVVCTGVAEVELVTGVIVFNNCLFCAFIDE